MLANRSLGGQQPSLIKVSQNLRYCKKKKKIEIDRCLLIDRRRYFDQCLLYVFLKLAYFFLSLNAVVLLFISIAKMKTIWLLFAFCLVFVLPIAASTENLKLLFVQILFRHGDRAPTELYPKDPNPATLWPEGLGKLTLLGRKEHYNLGKFLRNFYKNFSTSNPLEIVVTSSATDRCFKSAETNLASFYAPDDDWKFEKGVDWQPIYINYIPNNEDKYLETDNYCPRADAEEKRLHETPEGKKFLAKHKEMFAKLSVYSGNNITDWKKASSLYDVLFTEKQYNLTVPKWAEPYWEELKEVSDMSFFWRFNSPLLQRLRAGPLLKRMRNNMLQKLRGNIEELKFCVYSGHDTNVAVILDSLNLFNMKQPPYCATLLFELYGGPNLTSFIRLLYLNSTEPEKVSQVPHVLTLDGCSEYCPLDYFLNYTQPLIPDNWEKECVIKKSLLEEIAEEGLTIAIVFMATVLIILFMTFVAILKVYENKREKYAFHLMPLDH